MSEGWKETLVDFPKLKTCYAIHHAQKCTKQETCFSLCHSSSLGSYVASLNVTFMVKEFGNKEFMERFDALV